MDIVDLLRIVVNRKASDLHIVAGSPAKMRVNGQFEIVESPTPISAEGTWDLAKQIMGSSHENLLAETGSVDLSYSLDGEARFRVALFRAQGCTSIVMRLIPSKFLTFKELGLDEQTVADLIEAPRGLVLVTGPTGSGKSTTLASIINRINANCDDVHIITIEDPIEFVHRPIRAVVNQREILVDTQSFAHALRGALRQDPDVILIGEMRDLETMETALNAAETGHLVFATLHTSSAAQTIDRIINSFPTGQQEQVRATLSTALRTIIAQALIPRKDGKGRVAAFEILHNIPAVSNLIRKGQVERITSVIQTNATIGMRTMDDALFDLAKTGIITGNECLRRAYEPGEMRKKLMGRGERPDEY